MEHINIRSSQIGVEKRANCKFTSLQVLNLLMLFPFFVVKNACQYSGSALSHLFVCEKDMFYRFMNDGNVRWRKLLYAMNLQLIKKIQHESNVSHDKPVSLIIDDTDCIMCGYKLPVDGYDVVNVTGISRGKRIGEILDKLYDMACMNPKITKKECFSFLHSLQS